MNEFNKDQKKDEIEFFLKGYLLNSCDKKHKSYSQYARRFLNDLLEQSIEPNFEEVKYAFQKKYEIRKEYNSGHAMQYCDSFLKSSQNFEYHYYLFFKEVNALFAREISVENVLKFKKSVAELELYKLYNKYYDNGSINAFFTSIEKDYEDKNVGEDEYFEGKQKIYVGAPGVGKSYKINIETENVSELNKIRTVFHPDYENHDFVGSILPVVNDGSVTYEFKPGPFTRCLMQAHKNPRKDHYLIIEEITRGNASAIFGEVFQLLDRKVDGESEYPITNEEMAKAIYGVEAANMNFKVVIPKNVSILATANTSDQNVYVLDTAFKRRFEFEYLDVEADEEVDLPDINVFGRKWKDIYMSINKYIVDVLEMSEDKQIGPFFIKNQSELSKLCRYLWEDIDKASFLSEKTIFSDKYSNRFSDINKLCNKAIIDDTVTAEIMLSDNFLQFIKGNNEE